MDSSAFAVSSPGVFMTIVDCEKTAKEQKAVVIKAAGQEVIFICEKNNPKCLFETTFALIAFFYVG